MKKVGTVYLVGAGPGHPDLLTVKAVKLLRSADVVVYDRLIQEEVLTLGNPLAEWIYMGKTVGGHVSRQQEIQELLVLKAREGKTVVRLKGGDPYLFGRGSEEAEYLVDHGIPFDVVPGVCSALSAPLSAGISVTHRDIASGVAIVTGHFSTDENEQALDFSALARIPTLVVLMGVHTVAKVSERLIAAGRDPQTPAAIVQTAYWRGEKIVTGTLATIARDAQSQNVKAPATLIIGEVVRLRAKLAKATRELQNHSFARACSAESASLLTQLAESAQACSTLESNSTLPADGSELSMTGGIKVSLPEIASEIVATSFTNQMR